MTREPALSAESSTAPVFVTGAAGHVGANLVRRLLDDGVRVRVLLRHGDNNAALEGLDVERTFGDIRDLNATRRAMDGCRGVYHVAARISTIEGNRAHRREVFDCNVVGTRNVLRAAGETEAGRVVMTGSFSAVGYDLDNPSAPSNEAMQFYPMERTMPYERSKSLAEHECWRAAAAGQDVVVATCCAVVGGADFLPSRLGTGPVRLLQPQAPRLRRRRFRIRRRAGHRRRPPVVHAPWTLGREVHFQQRVQDHLRDHRSLGGGVGACRGRGGDSRRA